MWKNNITCLLVDDDPDDQEIFISALEEINESIACVTANNGVEALEKLMGGNFSPDFIFLDLNMPMMDGKQCLAEIKKIPALSHIPVVIYSTSSNQDDIDETRLLGISYFLTKPSSFAKLISLLNSFFESQRVSK